MIERTKQIDGRPFQATSSRAAAQLGLPPDTPYNLVASIARKRRAINELHEIQKEYLQNAAGPKTAPAPTTPAESDAKLVGRENQDEFKAPSPKVV